MKTFALAGVAYFAVTAAASAATIGATNFDVGILQPGTNPAYEETWEVGSTPWDVDSFSITLNGFSAGADLPLVSFSLENEYGTTTYTEGDWDISTNGTLSNGRLFIDGFTATEDFKLSFDYGNGTLPGVAVPLPASALLLLAGVGGLAGLKKLRRKA